MRYYITLIILLIVIFNTFAQEDNTSLAEAETAYEQGNYARAIEIYESLISDGATDADVYFNLGTAYYESGQLGLALVTYLHAQQQKPRDSQIKDRIARIRAERVDYQRDEQYVVDRLATSTKGLFTITEFAVFAFILWCMCCGLITVWFLRKEHNTRIRPMLIGMILLALIVNGLLFTRLYADQRRSPAVVINRAVQVMSGPGDNYLPLYQLYDAAEMRIIASDGIWVRFVLPDGRQGWLPRNEVIIV